MRASPESAELLSHTLTSTGETLAALSDKSPVLLVLLRHEGCTFCRNAMSDIARLRRQIEETGTRIVLGHMDTAEEFAAFAERYGLADVYCYSSDYPHVEGGTDPMGVFAARLAPLGGAVLEKFFVTNGELLLP